MPSSPDSLIEIESTSKAITEKSGSNLAFSFVSLPQEKRHAMSSFYAFCRVADDIVDEEGQSAEHKRQQIDAWREEIRACYLGTPSTSLGRELKKVIRRWLIPPEPLFEILAGVEMDLTQSRYETFKDLSLYCHRVASAVGLISIEIFEYSEPQAKDYALALGMAFQLTNILRDVGYDLHHYDRVYLPQEDLKRFSVTEDDLLAPEQTPARRRLLLLQYHRASHFFHKAARLFPRTSRKNFIAAEIMTEIYYRLLEKLRRQDFPIGREPKRLSKVEKMFHLVRALHGGASLNNKFRHPPANTVVIGAGFAGMSAALHLSREGHQVTLLESKTYIGGRAHSFTEPKTQLILDNGQHILMGCYHHCLEMVDLIGVRDRLNVPDHLRVPYRNRDGTESWLDASQAPPPFHLLTALSRFKEINWHDRLAMIGFALRVQCGARPRKGETVGQWLKRHGQTPGAMRALWEPYCVAALNEPTETASAHLFDRVLRQSLFGGPRDASIYLANVGLSDLFMPELQWMLESTGGKVASSTSVKSLEFSEKHVTRVFTSRESIDHPDQVVSAVPWKACRSLLPPDDPLRDRLASIGSSPILAWHVLCDVELTREMFVGFLDARIDWIFNRTPQLEKTHQGKYLYSIVISAASSLDTLKTPEIEAILWKEIGEFFPEARKATIEHSVMYRSRDATFAARPEVEPLRPGPQTRWENFWLAGDWTTTDLPATLEGAALSGKRIAQKLR